MMETLIQPHIVAMPIAALLVVAVYASTAKRPLRDSREAAFFLIAAIGVYCTGVMAPDRLGGGGFNLTVYSVMEYSGLLFLPYGAFAFVLRSLREIREIRESMEGTS